MDTLKVAVVGTGIGARHLEDFAKAPDVELSAICYHSNREKAQVLASRHGAKQVYADYGEMLERVRPDVVSIGTPNDLHASMTIEALRAGAHVLCDKPMATTVRDAEAMVAEAKKREKLLVLNMSRRFRPAARSLRAFASSGALGEVYHGKATWLRRWSTPCIDYEEGRTGGQGAWFVERKRAGGGALFDIGVHMYDLCWWLAGSPKALSVRGFTYSGLRDEEFRAREIECDVDLYATALVSFEGGASVHLEVSWAVHGADRLNVEVFGTKAGIAVNPPRVFTLADGKPVDREIDPPRPEWSESPQEHIVACVRDPGRERIATGEEGLEVMRVLAAIQESAEKGKEIRIRR